MPRKRPDPPEPRANPEHHWALFQLLAGVRRGLEQKHRTEQVPHVLTRPAMKARDKQSEC